MASGDSLVNISTPWSAEYPAANWPQRDKRNNRQVLDFATGETAYFTRVMPSNYGGGGVTVTPIISMETATSGDVVIEVAFERIGDGVQNLDSDGFATAQSSTTTVPGVAGDPKECTAITFTDGAQMDSVVAGDLFRISITRSATGNTATGDLELLGIKIEET